MLNAHLGKLKGILEDLLLYSKMYAQDLRPQNSAVCVPEVIARLAARYSSVWKEKDLKVDISFSDPFPPLQADPGLLETALRHLLLNAIYFNHPGGSISIRGEVSGGHASISFADTGIGMPQEALLNLGEGFYQAAEHLTRQVGGLGLGLAIVRRIAEAHGGLITVRSEEGEGREFTLALPLASAQT